MPLPWATHVLLATLHDTAAVVLTLKHVLAPSTPSTSTHGVHVPSKQLKLPLEPSVQVPEAQLVQLAAAVLPATLYGADTGHTVGLPAPAGQ
jgi:hypothetical protein